MHGMRGRTGEEEGKSVRRGNDGGLKEGGSTRVAGKWKAWVILQNRTIRLDVGLGEEGGKKPRCFGYQGGCWEFPVLWGYEQGHLS